MDQAVYYDLGLCLLILGNSGCLTVYKHHHSFVYGINQISKVTPKFKYHWLLELMCHQAVAGFAGMGVAFCLSFFALPFAVKFDPVQLIFGTHLPVKFLASFIYGLPISYGICTVVSIIPLIVGYTEGLILSTLKLNERHEEIPNIKRASVTMSEFHKFYHTFMQIRIHFAIFAEIANSFLTILIMAGVMLATCTGYATLKMYDMLPIHVYLGMPLVMTSCFVMAIVHNAMEGILQENANFFKKFWLRWAFKKEVRRITNSIPELGCKLGCYGTATHLLGLEICDDIIQNLISLLLLSPI